MSSQLVMQKEHYIKQILTKKIKYCVFQLFVSVNSFRNTNKLIGIILMLLSFLEIASFIKFHLPNEEIDEFQSILSPLSIILNLSIYLYPNSISNQLLKICEIIIYCWGSVVLVLLGLLFYLVITSKSYFATSFLLRYFFLLYQWVLFMPVIQVLYHSISFDSNASITKAVIHIILILIFVLFQFLLCYFNLISSISESDFFKIKDTTISVSFFFLQIISMFLGTLMYHSIIFLFIGYLVIFCMLINVTFNSLKHYTFYSKSFMRTYIVLMCMMYERFVNSIINKITVNWYSKPFKTYYITTLGIVFFSYLLIEQIFFKKVIDYSLRINFNKIKTSKEFVRYYTSLHEILDSNSGNKEFQIKKIGVSMNHLTNCPKEAKCLLNSKEELYLPKIQITSQKHLEFYLDRVKTLFMIKELFGKYYKFFQFYFDFCLCYILFLIFIIGNNELALSEIEMSKRFVSLSLSQEFIMFLLKEYSNYRIMRLCENKSDTNDINSNKLKANRFSGNYTSLSGEYANVELNLNYIGGSTWPVLSLLNVVNYDKVTSDIKNYIYLCLDTKRDLWKIFLNEDIILEEIFRIGTRLFEYKSRISILWKEINFISNDQPDNEITRIYCDYLDKLCDDKIESRFILEKTPPFIINTPDELYNNRYKADTGIVIIEGNCAIDPGKITYINQPLVTMLGYHKNELIDNNIKAIIPGDIGRYHDEIIINYFEKGRSNILKKTMNTLSVKTKQKYLIPIHLLVTILPNIGKKMEGIGLIRPQQKKKIETIITTENGTIEALTENMGKLLNITPSLIEKSHIYVQCFFPELMKPEKGSIPKFLTDEYFNSSSAIDLKININCPKKNMIDTSKIKVKTKNINYHQSHSISNANDYLSNKSNLKKANIKPIKYTVNISQGSDDNSKHPIQEIKYIQNNYQPPMPNPGSLINNQNVVNYQLKPSNLNMQKIQRSLFTQAYGKINQIDKRKGENLIHFSPSIDKLTPNMEQIIKYRKTSLELLGVESNINLRTKLNDIYNSMLLAHEYNSLTEKAEVILIHLGMKIYNNSIPVRILMISSEMLFEDKKIEGDFSCVSEVNFAERKNDNLIQKCANDEDKEMDPFFDTGSVSGKDSNILLQKHLKNLRKDNINQFCVHKSIGILMGLTVIITELSIVCISNHLFNYVMSSSTLIKHAFSLNTLLVDISKYSIIEQLERKFALVEYKNYGIIAKELRISRSKELLSLLDNYFTLIQKIYTPQELEKMFDKHSFDFLLTNRIINMTFINSIYRLVSDAIEGSTDSLQATSTNFINSVRTHFIVIKDIFGNNYLKYSSIQFIIEITLVTFGLLILIGFLSVLLYSYKTNRKEQTKLLSAYEQIKNDEIEHILNLLDIFEGKYLDSFKIFDEYKTKKITFQKENTQFLFKKYQNKLKREKEGESKVTYNILSNTKVEEEIEEKTKKNLIYRQNMVKKYIISFLTIFSIVIIYTIFFYFEVNYVQTIINHSQTIVFNLFHSKFLMNYLSFKLDDIVAKRMDVLSKFREIHELQFKELMNMTHSDFNYLTIEINNNPSLFLPNISDIMSGEICNVLKLKYCTSNDIKFRGENGMRAITSFYFKSIEDAYLFYKNNYNTIDDIQIIITHEKFGVERFLIENIVDIYDEIFVQMNVSVERLLLNGLIQLITVGVVLGTVFIISLVFRLSSFIEGIKQEETLCKKVISELPYDIVRGNYEMQKQLTGLLSK